MPTHPNPYREGLDRNPANHVPLTPLSLLEWAADVYPDQPAVIHGALRRDWKTLRDRAHRLAATLAGLDIGDGDTVSVVLPNTPPMIEAHFGVPMTGAVLNTINTRLDAATVAFMLEHCAAKVLITDTEFSPMVGRALAPIVHSMLISAPAPLKDGIGHTVKAMVAGASPPASMIAGMQELGFELTHVYGLTEVYGPAASCAPQPDWADLELADRVRKQGRQGVRYQLQEGLSVRDPVSMQPVPADGETLGEVMFRGNITMKGYLKNPSATEAAFRDGWFHTGDLGVIEPDGYVKLKDRAKDIIISGGENISSIEIEDALYRHPAVLFCAVIARPDPKWGETPLAFVELREGATVTAEALISHCRSLLAGFKTPREIRFETLPKTSTGKIQKHLLRARVNAASAI